MLAVGTSAEILMTLAAGRIAESLLYGAGAIRSIDLVTAVAQRDHLVGRVLFNGWSSRTWALTPPLAVPSKELLANVNYRRALPLFQTERTCLGQG